MVQEIINKYTDEVLYNTLVKFNVKEKYILEITNDIKEQIYSILYHWNDIRFRKALLIIGLEEGKFYEPEADLDIKCFVVVAIRNSLLEIIFSDESNLMELKEPVIENNVRLITMDAINYFKNIDFKALSNEVIKIKFKDRYGEVVEKYPMAWEGFIQLGNCLGKKAVYKKVEIKNKIDITNLIENTNDYNNKKSQIRDVQSGISASFSKGLAEILKDNSMTILYIDCLKMLTRNFEKLLKVVEILLENDRIFLTSNYLITNSYVSKRSEIYRASHRESDVMDKMKSNEFLLGISKTHRKFLEDCISQMM